MGLVLVWIWGTAAAVMSAGDRHEVLAVASDVEHFEPIERSDLQVVRVGLDPQVATVAASELDEVVGQVAATDLVEGALLAPDQVIAKGDRIVGDGEALVGVRLEPGELPPEGTRSGAEVLVVIRPAQAASGTGEIVQIGGWLVSVGADEGSTGEQSASLVVARSEAPVVSAAAAEDRVSLVVLEG